jgi:RND family efflux transporter MFP subunit
MNMITKIVGEETADSKPVLARVRQLPRWQRGALVMVPVALAAAGLGLFNREPAAVAAPPPPVMTVAAPLVRQVSEWDEYIGRFEASRSVEVRPRVAGAITGIHFADGAYVRKGQLLFTIDARPFAAALAEARAGLGSAASELALARADLGRATRLLEVDAVSRSDVDRLTARVRSAEAALAAARARVRSRALDMEFTRVVAPISGRVSDRRIDAGNLVNAGEGATGTLLTTINAVDPIHFAFEGSESLFLKMKRAQQAGSAVSPVEIRLQDETGYRWRGRLDFTDNGLDPRSGTIRGRAVLDNPDRFLTPGMFGNMRLSSGGTTAALLVPDAAIQTDQARKLVFVVGRDGSLAPRPVELGPLVDGLRVVRSGLARTDRVVIAGAQLAMPGAKVGTRPGRIEPTRVAEEPRVDTPVSGEATLTR